MSECACQPGTNDNGWHETRCSPCVQVERDTWARAVALAITIAQRLRK